MVDQLGPFRGGLRRPDLARAHDPGVRPWHVDRADPDLRGVVRDSRVAAIDLDQSLGRTIAAAVNPDLGGDPAAGFFEFVLYYPLPIFISLVSILLLFVFFVAGADAGTIVLGQLSAGGVRNVNRFVRLAWGVVIGAMAFVLLAAGGLDAFRQACSWPGYRAQ